MKNKYNNKIEVSVRAILQKGNRILVCKMLKKNYYFFPGGHVEYKESLIKALKRELKEELGIKIDKQKLIGLVENIYSEDKVVHHELNFVYNVTFKSLLISSRERHIGFEFLSWNKFSKTKVYPIKLQQVLQNWKKDNKLFVVNER